jgi:hypothetical protein
MNESKWKDMTCNFCGAGTHAVVSIRIEIPESKNEYPFTQTDLCLKCWNKMGLVSAIQHNEDICRECEGVEPHDLNRCEWHY